MLQYFRNLYSTFQSPWVDLPCRPQDIGKYFMLFYPPRIMDPLICAIHVYMLVQRMVHYFRCGCIISFTYAKKSLSVLHYNQATTSF